MPANSKQSKFTSYEEGGPHLRDLVATLRRRWKLVAGFALCGAMLAFFIGTSIPPRYTAKAFPGDRSRRDEELAWQRMRVPERFDHYVYDGD